MDSNSIEITYHANIFGVVFILVLVERVCVFPSNPKWMWCYFTISASASDRLHVIHFVNLIFPRRKLYPLFICFSGWHSFILVHYILMMLFHRFNSVVFSYFSHFMLYLTTNKRIYIYILRQCFITLFDK